MENVSLVHLAAPTVLATEADLHMRARLGLAYLVEALNRIGWYSNCASGISTSFSVETKDFGIDVSIIRSASVAYVTSYPGYKYEKKVVGKDALGNDIMRVNAKVTFGDSLLGSKYSIRIVPMLRTGVYCETLKPVMIAIDGRHDPAIEIVRHTLLAIKDAFGSDALLAGKIEHEVKVLEPIDV